MQTEFGPSFVSESREAFKDEWSMRKRHKNLIEEALTGQTWNNLIKKNNDSNRL